MLHAESPAASFFTRLHGFERSRSCDSSTDLVPDVSVSAASSEAEGSDAGVRRAKSLHNPGRILDARRDVAGLSSFSAAGTTLTSPSLPAQQQAPLAARHALFSHHARAVSATVQPISISGSDVGSTSPPSPTLSSVSSGAFSPASAFLSHFSSNTSLRPPSSLAPDAPGAKVLGYTLGKVLGRGGFSTVRLAINDRGEELACKIVKRDDLSDRSGSLEKFEEEIRIWSALPHHPSLLPLLEMERTSFATFLITPLLPGGNLLDVLRREGGSDKTARKWFPGVVKAVQAMHTGYEGFDGNLLHGDLKLDNFLVDHEGQVMACDFYMAKLIDEPTVPPPQPPPRRPRQSAPNSFPSQFEPVALPPHMPSASLPYAPPELLSAPQCKPSLAQDMWALGIVLHALLTGKLPFVDSFDPRLQMKILRGQWEEPQYLGREWLEVLRGCLDGNKDTRWTIQQVASSDALIGWKEVKQRSRSRSRRRPSLEYGADPLTSQPSRGSSRSRTRPEEGYGRRGVSREGQFGRSAGTSGSLSTGAGYLGSQIGAASRHAYPSHDHGDDGRDRSGSNSRSRSSGRNQPGGSNGLFTMEPDSREDLDGSMENLHVQTRGRLPHKISATPPPISSSADQLHFYRQDHAGATGSRGGSRSRTRNDYTDGQRTESGSRSRTREGDGSPSRSKHPHPLGSHQHQQPYQPYYAGQSPTNTLNLSMTHSYRPPPPFSHPAFEHLQDHSDRHGYGTSQGSTTPGTSQSGYNGTSGASGSSRSRSRTPWDGSVLGVVDEEGTRPGRGTPGGHIRGRNGSGHGGMDVDTSQAGHLGHDGQEVERGRRGVPGLTVEPVPGQAEDGDRGRKSRSRSRRR